jgi:hypothetical protein
MPATGGGRLPGRAILAVPAAMGGIRGGRTLYDSLSKHNLAARAVAGG